MEMGKKRGLSCVTGFAFEWPWSTGIFFHQEIKAEDKMRKHWIRSTIEAAIDECRYEVHDLSEDMRDVFERTPEVFQSTTGKPREEAADNLEFAYDELLGCGVPEQLRNEDVEWLELRRGINRRLFRPARRNNVVSCLRACVARLSAARQDDDTTKLKNKLQGVIDVLDGIFFPGMTGRRAA